MLSWDGSLMHQVNDNCKNNTVYKTIVELAPRDKHDNNDIKYQSGLMVSLPLDYGFNHAMQ